MPLGEAAALGYEQRGGSGAADPHGRSLRGRGAGPPPLPRPPLQPCGGACGSRGGSSQPPPAAGWPPRRGGCGAGGRPPAERGPSAGARRAAGKVASLQ